MITQDRKHVIQEMVIGALNWMGSHFFHATLAFETPEEAQYAASLWHRGSYDYNQPLKANFIA